MRIIRFSYYDKTRNWGFENLEFLKLTLLVGASGVGKTQILRAIENIIQVSDGTSFNGITWDITFESIAGNIYHWTGEFENKPTSSFEDMGKIQSPGILNEQLTENDKVIITRNENSILFQGKETVKLSPYQSALYLLKAEPVIKEIQSGFSKIKMIETSANDFSTYIYAENTLTLYKSVREIINSDLTVDYKLLIAYYLPDKTLFDSIKQRYMDIFPQIEDIQIIKNNYIHPTNQKLNIYNVQFKEKEVEEWILPDDMSSGMLRSFNQICELYLSPEGSVLLMDEFENSLGVNCIDELTNDILSSRRNIQFILTSHHPYIINNIPYQNWKIVTRKAGKVTVKSASDYRIGESKHDYFMQLLQLDDFSNGVD